MKKTIAIILAALMLTTLSLPAFAATDLSTNPAKGNPAGDYSINVAGKFTASGAADTVISADIKWNNMSFTYTAGSTGTWNPDTHAYDNSTNGSWSTGKADITVTNHSNSAIDATVAFTSAVEGVVGTFYKDENGAAASTAATEADKTLKLATAVGTMHDNAPEQKIWFGIGGAAITQDTDSLGSLTITIAQPTTNP